MAKFCRFEKAGLAQYGVVRGERVETLSGPPWADSQPTDKSYALKEVRLLAPCEPTKIVCLGRNYREHAAEMGHEAPREPLIFLKPPSAVIASEEAIVYPPISQRVDYEGELAVVMGRKCRHLPPHNAALGYVFGFTCLNDVTARDIQKAEGRFTRAKGFDTFCPLGPVMATGLEPTNLIVETYVNGEQRQHGRVREMIFSLDAIIRYVSSVMTLLPGDVIATGTPAGVGPLKIGDVVEVVIAGIGRLRNPVVVAS